MPRRKLLVWTLAVGISTAAAIFPSTAQQPPAAPSTIKVHFKNIHCESCAQKIRSRIFTVAGVRKVETSVPKDLAIVTPVPGKVLSIKSLWEALDQGKFDVDHMETPDGLVKEKPTS